MDVRISQSFLTSYHVQLVKEPVGGNHLHRTTFLMQHSYCLIMNHGYEQPYDWSSCITLREEWADILSNIVKCPGHIKDIEKYRIIHKSLRYFQTRLRNDQDRHS